MPRAHYYSLLGNLSKLILLLLLVGLPFLYVTVSAQPLRLGDLDADDQPTVLDLVRLINHINGTASLSSALAPYGDINEDGIIDQRDVDLLQSAILGQMSLPNPFSPPLVSSPVTSTNGPNILLTGVAR